MSSYNLESRRELFWSLVAVGAPGECWVWRGRRGVKGRGYFGYSKDGRCSQLTANRAAWVLTYGPIDSPRTMVCHSCDNPPCVNPAHLWLGTAADNQYDSYRKGRTTNLQTAKANPVMAAEIRARRSAGETLQSLADAYGLSLTATHDIVSGRSWGRRRHRALTASRGVAVVNGGVWSLTDAVVAGGTAA